MVDLGRGWLMMSRRPHAVAITWNARLPGRPPTTTRVTRDGSAVFSARHQGPAVDGRSNQGSECGARARWVVSFSVVSPARLPWG